MPAPLADLQRGFAAAVMDAATPVPTSLASRAARRPERRFAVYRNNVFASLIGILEARFPVVRRVVGEAFFRATARAYIEAEPPDSPVLLRYGGGFQGFLARFPPVADLPYLPDVAGLEWARHEATHAADAEPLDAAALAGVAPDAVAQLRLRLHPSLRLAVSRHPIVTIWEANSAGGEVGPIDLGRAEAALVVRPHLRTDIVRIELEAVAFISALRDGHALQTAFEAAAGEAPGFDLARSLAGLIGRGAVVGIQPQGA